MRLTQFRELVATEFGVARGDLLVEDFVLPGFGVTAAQAIEAGADPRDVRRAMCEEFDIPESRR